MVALELQFRMVDVKGIPEKLLEQLLADIAAQKRENDALKIHLAKLDTAIAAMKRSASSDHTDDCDKRRYLTPKPTKHVIRWR